MDTFPPMTPSTQVSLSPVETRSSSSFSRQRTPSEPHPLRRSHTLDVQIAANVDQLSVNDIIDRPLHRTKRSRSLFEGQLEIPVGTHASRVESRSESAVY
ncbi:hypothetical protein EXIGLDRAFT_716723 [Exidia glandulosa HHB12029]|nr:hypothetical protein EXIGLDRAFT_716723 [Exidia glandulosa HHB12029]